MTDGYKIKRILTWVNEVRLPAEYQEVEYIQSSGTQWIDTGVTPTQNTKSQIKFMNLETTGELIYGIYTGSDSTDYRLFNASGTMYFDFSSSRISGSTIEINTVYELELGNYYVKNVGESGNIISGTSISSYTGGRTITLNNYNNSIYSKNRWYYVKIWNGDTQVRDLVPCYRKSDSVIGMYDTINDVFYTNSGTGLFTKGNDVPDMVEKQIYPATYNPGSNTIAYYTFDGQNLNDSSGNNNNASWYNGAGSYVSVGGGYCANLGGSHAIDLPFTVAGLTNWTMNIWMNVQGTKTISGILGTRAWQTGTFHMNYLYNFSGRTGINITVNPESDIDWSGVLTIGNWYNIVVTKSGTTYSIYINSNLGASGNRGNFTDTNTLCLGTTYDSTRCFNGYLDSAIFENKAWSADEITAYYNITKGNYGL